MTLKSLSRKLYLLYYRYKDSPYFSLSLYISILLISVVLFFYVIFPQVTNWFSVRKEVEATRERIGIMNDNIAYLQSLDQADLEDDFVTATTALPPERDVSILISAINAASLNAGVILEDFSFEGGQVSSKSTQSKPQEADTTAKITFSAQGSLAQTTLLLTELQRKIPLLSIETLEAQFESANRAQVTVSYFYKAFPLITQEDADKIKGITPENEALLEQLKSWQTPSQREGFFSGDIDASSSADPL
jgi:hypothetical protein